VRWVNAAENLVDHWSNIRRSGDAADSGPLDLAGCLDGIVEVYRRVPSGRLVVLGRAGSGKTIPAIRLVLGLLDRWREGDLVPMIVNVSEWNPLTTSIRDWLVQQSVRDYPALGAVAAPGSTLAASLVDAERILPVFDGFDEIAAGSYRAAIAALNVSSTPLVLTSRPTEFASAVDAGDVLTAAAVVELNHLTVADLVDYLPAFRPKDERDGDQMGPVLVRSRSAQHRSRLR
jgi:predicted NACHT family NTPase